jgi:hypothetical protein
MATHRNRDTRLAARFAWPSKLAQNPVAPRPCASGPRPRRRRSPPSPFGHGDRPGHAPGGAFRLAQQARTESGGTPPLCERASPAKAAPAAVPVRAWRQAKAGTRACRRVSLGPASSHRIRWHPAPVRAGLAREGGAHRRPRSGMATSQSRDTRLPARFAWPSKLAQNPVAPRPCASGPRPRRRRPPPFPVRAWRQTATGTRAWRRVSLGPASSHRIRWHPAPVRAGLAREGGARRRPPFERGDRLRPGHAPGGAFRLQASSHRGGRQP